MSANELDPIKQELSKIRTRYDEIIADFDELRKINPIRYKQSALKEGLVLKVAKSAETIIKYVCKSSNIKIEIPPSRNGAPSFNDYIYNAYNKGLINDKLKSEFEQIRNIRNISAHHDGAETFNLEHDELSIHKAEVVEDALTYITDWFFHTFLKEKYPELSLKRSIPKEEPIKYQKYEPATVIVEPKAPIAQKTTNKPTQKTNKIRTKNISYVIFLVIGLLLLVLYFQNGKLNNVGPQTASQNSLLVKDATTNTNQDLHPIIEDPNDKNNRKLAQKILQAYYDSIAAHTFVANDFFADDIDEFKGLLQSSAEKDIEPKDITRLISKSKFEINPDFTIQNSNLTSNNSKLTFPIWKYVCSSNELIENDDTNRKIIIEFSFNAELKLRSLIENYVEDDFEGS